MAGTKPPRQAILVVVGLQVGPVLLQLLPLLEPPSVAGRAPPTLLPGLLGPRPEAGGVVVVGWGSHHSLLTKDRGSCRRPRGRRPGTGRCRLSRCGSPR